MTVLQNNYFKYTYDSIAIQLSQVYMIVQQYNYKKYTYDSTAKQLS